VFKATAQEKWNMRSIVEYAMANNINVRLSDVQSRISAINYNQNKLSLFPNLNLNSALSLNSGTTQDPVTFARTTESFLGSNIQLQSSADIFNFFSKRNAITASRWEMEAARANVDKLKNDIALTVANAYLQILLSREQQAITGVQLEQTKAQLSVVRKQVEAGALPELNAVQLEAQLAADSVNFINAKGNVDLAILQLKAFMNIDAAAPFEVDAPPVDQIPVEAIADLQPEFVYKLALANQPLQRVNEFRLKAAQSSVLAARGAMYPSLSAFGSLGSRYNNQVITILDVNSVGLSNEPVGAVNVGGVNYNVFTFKPDYLTEKTPLFTQFQDNFNQSIGLSLNVPLFNGGTSKSNWRRSKLNVETAKLQQTADDQKLKQDIYQAYTSAVMAFEKFTASEKSVTASELSLNYATKRFEVGMLGTFELITTQNNLLRARLEYSLNRYDYVFKMKVLEFYKGLGLKL
jgi:outer membrane protein